MKAGSFFLIGGGALIAGAGAWFGKKKMDETTEAIEDAVDAPPVFIPPQPPLTPVPQEILNKLPTVKIHATGYWPYVQGLNAKERTMEGGSFGAAIWRGAKAIDPTTGKRPVIYTLEQHMSDPVKYPYVSISGDPDVWPFGQRIILSPWPTAVMRIVDTGSHFTGIHKTYRILGEEPLDVAVNSSATPVPKKNVTAKIVSGDTFASKKTDFITSNLKNQAVTFTGDIREGYTTDDHTALARALESELGNRPKEEQVAAAWTVRNRANQAKTSIKGLLAPRAYGSPATSKGYASTRRKPSNAAQAVAADVLGADQAQDPTDGATDFWMPAQQSRMRQLGDVYRAAKRNGDIDKAVKYSRYAKFGSEGDVRTKQARQGLRVVNVIGALELLKKVV